MDNKARMSYRVWSAKRIGETDEDILRRKEALNIEHMEYNEWLCNKIKKEFQDSLKTQVLSADKLLEHRKEIEMKREYFRTRDKVKWSAERMGDAKRKHVDLTLMRDLNWKYVGGIVLALFH